MYSISTSFKFNLEKILSDEAINLIVEKAIENIDETIDLHRPFVDDVHLKCPKCGKPMTRTKDVIDCWFDSGSMPFAQYHWPFENDGVFEDQFPADFICEGIDQTRGWFYTLIIISVFLKGCAPFKNVLVNDLIQDAEGKKMSKSKGNIVEPFTTMKEFGADVVRFYLPYVSPVWTPLRFDINGLKEVYSKFFNPLKNTYSFFALYANTKAMLATTINFIAFSTGSDVNANVYLVVEQYYDNVKLPMTITKQIDIRYSRAEVISSSDTGFLSVVVRTHVDTALLHKVGKGENLFFIIFSSEYVIEVRKRKFFVLNESFCQ